MFCFHMKEDFFLNQEAELFSFFPGLKVNNLEWGSCEELLDLLMTEGEMLINSV